MIPPRDILDHLVAEFRVGARAPADVLTHLRDAGAWNEAAASQLLADIRGAHGSGRLTDVEADDLRRGVENWLVSMVDEDPTEPVKDDAVAPVQRTRESHVVPPLELRPGVVLCDRYVLGETVVRGGQSIVFRAQVLHGAAGAGSEWAVAIKTPREATAAAVARLKREFRQTQSLRHPGVPVMYDLECDRGTWFIAMEWLEGVSLHTRLNRVATQPLGTYEALRIVAKCAAVLGQAHRQGFGHGDVKPGNLFLQEAGGIKVLDFGAAYDIQPPPPFAGIDAEPDSAVATRAYASPEVLEGLAVEPRDDIFSLACVAYEMFAGRHPFSRMPANEARDRAMEVTPIDGLAPRQNAALTSALAWSRSNRPSSIEAWLEALLNHNPNVPVEANPQTKRSTPTEWLPWRWVGAVGAIAALFSVIWWGSDDRPATTPAVVGSPNASQLRVESPAVASRTLESTVSVPSAAVAQASTAKANAPSAPPKRVSHPVSTAKRGRIQTDTSIRISESAAVVAVVLRRTGNTAAPVTVKWQLQDGSARKQEDFTTPASRSARFAAGQATRAIYVPLTNDDRPEPEEFFSLILRPPAAATVESSRVTITILDDD